jgi:hypothetical protein
MSWLRRPTYSGETVCDSLLKSGPVVEAATKCRPPRIARDASTYSIDPPVQEHAKHLSAPAMTRCSRHQVEDLNHFEGTVLTPTLPKRLSESVRTKHYSFRCGSCCWDRAIIGSARKLICIPRPNLARLRMLKHVWLICVLNDQEMRIAGKPGLGVWFVAFSIG